MKLSYTELEAAEALTNVIGESRWEAVALAHGYLSLVRGSDPETAARTAFNRGFSPLRRARDVLSSATSKGFIPFLKSREKTGSAENPITKMFPAAITEERFIEHLESLREQRQRVEYSDDRDSRSLTDFTIYEGQETLPLNIKSAATPFRNSKQLVGLDPDDCIPIPAYKAHAALDVMPNLLYIISVDYDLVIQLDEMLSRLLDREEQITWALLNAFIGARSRDAEDMFVYSMTRKNWTDLKELSKDKPFNVISARKAIRILQKDPQRTPGIGLRAWGTGASAEVNVHVSIRQDTKDWHDVQLRIVNNGVVDVVNAVNRKKTEVVFDPEI